MLPPLAGRDFLGLSLPPLTAALALPFRGFLDLPLATTPPAPTVSGGNPRESKSRARLMSFVAALPPPPRPPAPAGAGGGSTRGTLKLHNNSCNCRCCDDGDMFLLFLYIKKIINL